MPSADRRPVILVTSFLGDPDVAELERRTATGERPRRDYVELMHRLDAVVIDADHMQHRANPVARAISRRVSMPAGQILEVFLRRRRYGAIVAWADRLGLGLAALLKLVRSRQRIVLISVLLSNPKKALPLKLLRLQTQIAAIITMGTVQLRIAADRLGVPEAKLHFGPHPVDLRFWRPAGRPKEPRTLCAVGWEARDYPTLFDAVEGLDVGLEVAYGTLASPDEGGVGAPPDFGRPVPANVVLRPNLKPAELRELHERAALVVIPLRDVDFDAGVTAITESLAMGNAVVASRTRGQVDVIRDGENGVYVTPGDAGELRATIIRLLDDPAERERLGRNGRAHVEAHHSLDRLIEQIAGLV